MKSKTYWTVSFSALLVLAAIMMIISLTPLRDSIFYSEPGFAGSHACKECHPGEFSLWLKSYHYHSSDSSLSGLLADNSTSFEYRGSGNSLLLHLIEGEPYVTLNKGEKDENAYPLILSVGNYPFVQFAADTGSGRLQILPAGLDMREASNLRLFRPDTLMSFDENSPFDWRGAGNNWNSRCASCHSTGVMLNFNPGNLSYNTSVSEIRVGCEGCHGPASNHIRWANKKDREEFPPEPDDVMGLVFKSVYDEPDWKIDPSTGNAFQNKHPGRETGINLCARCHSARNEIVSTGLYNYDYWDDFAPLLLDNGLYFSDGSMKGQSYAYGPFLQSRMFGAGVTCLDCHDAHSGRLYEAGNQLCARCHDAGKYDDRSHHFHDPDNEGGKCVDCHMPSRLLFGIDERADHYVRIPRPDLTVTTGSPNSCNNCHDEEEAGWAETVMRGWYGEKIFNRRAYAQMFHSLWTGGTEAPGLMASLIRDTGWNSFARASALAGIPLTDTAVFLELVGIGVENDDPLMRYAAVLASEKLEPLQAFQSIFNLLDDPERTVSFYALQSASRVRMDDLPREVKMGFSQAMNLYINLLVSLGDRPENIKKLANYYALYKDYSKAVPLYETALELDPSDREALSSLRNIYTVLNDNDKLRELERRFMHSTPDAGP